ncbi:hypothetical protein H0H92_013890 [Tricholoma furcatifolium]|nr:hypothetical protein H0H92_013890 [Tricholoma furcatifolium]
MQSPAQSPRAVQRPMRSFTVEMEHWRKIMPETAQGLPPRVPAPSHRHAAPSGEHEPGVDSRQLIDKEPTPTRRCDHSDPNKCNRCWSGYPQSLFPNWTQEQQHRSRILKIIQRRNDASTAYYVDVNTKGEFTTSKSLTIGPNGKVQDNHWEFMMQPRPEGTRLRALFLENLSGPVLQMLGTKYNIEPFYFSSSIGWIPSRYQEEIRPSEGDHITISLTFIRTMQNPMILPPSANSSFIDNSSDGVQPKQPEQVIDTQSALFIRSSDRILLPDLLALHMVRSHMNSTIISYHPPEEHCTTTAASLHSRLNATGHSVYWSSMFGQYDDPTFIFLSLLWYALYAWDEALEVLYSHICWVESRVIQTNDIHLTQELHVIQAHLLHYTSLLDDFRKTVVFIRDTPYPGLDNPSLYTAERRDRSNALLHKECTNLLNEIERLEMSREMQSRRLRNVMNLGFSSVNLEDSRHMQRLTEATVKDSAAMKQVAYLTMFFLPSSLVAGIFGMNVGEINPGTTETIPHFIAIAIGLTVLTFWGIGAFQFYPEGASKDEEETSLVFRILRRLGWPIMLAMERLSKKEGMAESKSSAHA